jgi:phage shock protein A
MKDITQSIKAFEAWWVTINQTIGRATAIEAWKHQQNRIDELEARLATADRLVSKLEQRCYPSKVIMISDTGHYVSEKVADRIDELEATVDYMERSHNKIVGLILNIDELEQDTDEMSEAQQDLLAIAQNSAVYGVPPKYRDISGRKRIDELELQIKQTVDNAISQASSLRDRIAELEAKVVELEAAIAQHKRESQEMKDYTRFPAYSFENTKLWQVIE